jgi:hypothetical protein
VNRLALPLLLSALGALLGCNSNRTDWQDTARVTRVTTSPTQATLIHVDTNHQFITPCDFTADQFDEDDLFQISKRGYATWEGYLHELPQIAQGTYLCELRPLR